MIKINVAFQKFVKYLEYDLKRMLLIIIMVLQITDKRILSFFEQRPGMDFEATILKFIDRLQSIETDNVDPTSNSLDQSLVMRDDIASDENSAKEILENAPEKELDFFSVPKVIE